MAAVALEQISKVYPNGFEAVKRIDMDVAEGEFMVLVGPSGCGKTTLLRMVAGLESITGGSLRIGGEVVNDLGPQQRDIAMVFQNYALYPHMTVGQNIGFALNLRKMPKAEMDAKIKEVAHILGLSEWIDRKPGQLSGGQRQRVAMGRAIVRQPSVFLMDEPLSNLDAKLRRSVRDEIRHLQQRLAVTTVYVTHDQEEAMGVADRMIVMRSGQIAQEGTPIELYDHPNSSFMADFIGDANLLGCDARRSQDGSWIATVQGEEIKVLQASIEPGPAKLVIRPDAITIAASPSHHGGLLGEVESCSFLGDRRLYKIRTAIGLLHHIEYHPQMSWVGLRSIEIKLNPARLRLVPG